jgi:2-keto-4-pentenoate hydratase
VLGWSACPVWAWSTLHDWATVVSTQIKDRQPLPVLSAYGVGLDMADAYAVQKLVVQGLAMRAKVAGYKAGLTRPKGQVRFNVREPVTGVVFRENILRGNPVLLRRQFKQLTIAPGLGFVLRAKVSAPLTDPAQTAALIAAVLPVIDFANFDFEQPQAATGTDLVAGNTATARVLVGKPLADSSPATLDGLLVELSREGTVVDRGRGVNVLGGQRQALMWLINRLLAQGWELPAGALLVTGGLSDPVPAKPGEYSAHFWDHGTLEFRIRP